jgi:non-specific serine/threonine protein kinase
MVEQGEREMLRSRHAAYYLAFAEQAEPNLRGPQQAGWLDRLEAEHDNLRAVLAWSLEEPTDLRVRLAGALWWFWFYQGHFGEGLCWLEQVLAHTATMGITAPRAKAFIGAAMLACYRGDLAQAQVLCETGLAMARSVEDNTGTTLALNILGTIARSQRNYAVAYQLYEESLAHARAIHHTWLTALALGNLGVIAFHQDDYQQAAAYCAESLALFRAVDDTWFIAVALNILGRVTHSTGDNRRADELHRESLALFRDLGNRWGIALCVGGLAAVAGAQGQPERAARLLGAEEALRETIGEPLFQTIRADHERMVAIVRAALSADVFVTAWASGRAMTLEQAIAYALEEEAKTKSS